MTFLESKLGRGRPGKTSHRLPHHPYLDFSLYFSGVNETLHSSLPLVMSMKYLYFSFLPKNSTLSSPLQLLSKAVGRNQIYENLPEGFVVPLFITELPNLVMAHTGEDSVCIRLYWYQIRLDWYIITWQGCSMLEMMSPTQSPKVDGISIPLSIIGLP